MEGNILILVKDGIKDLDKDQLGVKLEVVKLRLNVMKDKMITKMMLKVGFKLLSKNSNTLNININLNRSTINKIMSNNSTMSINHKIKLKLDQIIQNINHRIKSDKIIHI